MKVCVTFLDRWKGCMFQSSIGEDYLFPKCKSIHTFFMKTNIDVIALDKKGGIVMIYRNISPNKIIFTPKNTYSILETKTNSKYSIGDTIQEANFQR